MTYELAKELRDAGFPQKLPSGSFTIYGGQIKDTKTNENAIYVPTLSELIEACGEGEFMLHQTRTLNNPDRTPFWIASMPEHDRKASGSTPEEAVARLWLALNKKQP